MFFYHNAACMDQPKSYCFPLSKPAIMAIEMWRYFHKIGNLAPANPNLHVHMSKVIIPQVYQIKPEKWRDVLV